MPIWLVAIVCAAAAPAVVGLLADRFVAQQRRRTDEALRRSAGAGAP